VVGGEKAAAGQQRSAAAITHDERCAALRASIAAETGRPEATVELVSLPPSGWAGVLKNVPTHARVTGSAAKTVEKEGATDFAVTVMLRREKLRGT